METIDLTSIPSDFSEELLKVQLDFNEERQILSLIQARYLQQRDLSRAHSDRWLYKTNADLIEQIDQFIDKSFGDEKKALFRDVKSTQIHPASLILGMHASDHPPTLDMIERHINKEKPLIKIVRIKGGSIKKASLIETLTSVKDQKHLLVIIEQTEIVERTILNFLILYLYTMLTEGESRRLVVMFCLSSNCKDITQLLPTDTRNRLAKITTIVKEPRDGVLNMQSWLLEADDIVFEIGSNMMNLMYDNVLDVDASVENLRYIYQYAMFEHYSSYASLLTSAPKELAKLVKSHSHLVSFIKNLKSVKDSGELSTVDWRDRMEVAKYCRKRIEYLKCYHEYVWTQFYHYLNLLRDETDQAFPSRLNDIYSEFMAHDDLGQSINFADAISKIPRYPVESIVKRISLCTQEHVKSSNSIKCEDVYSILVVYKEKLENNDDCKPILKELADKLLKHSQILKNPLKMPLNEALYFNKSEIVRKRALPSTRFDALNDYLDKSNHFGILYRLIHNHVEEISAADLFNDFKDAVETDCQEELNSPEVPEVPPKKVKKLCRRGTRASTRITNVPQQEVKKRVVVNKFDDGLLKAIFVDLIDCMERQGLVKLDRRRSKNGIIRRSVWL